MDEDTRGRVDKALAYYQNYAPESIKSGMDITSLPEDYRKWIEDPDASPVPKGLMDDITKEKKTKSLSQLRQEMLQCRSTAP